MHVAELLALPADEAVGTFVSAVVASNGALTEHEVGVVCTYFELFVRNAETIDAILEGQAVLCRAGDGRFQFENVSGSLE
jgi:hypothetical protein